MTSGVSRLITNPLRRSTGVTYDKLRGEQDRSHVLRAFFQVIDQEARRDSAKLARWLAHNRQSRAQER